MTKLQRALEQVIDLSCAEYFRAPEQVVRSVLPEIVPSRNKYAIATDQVRHVLVMFPPLRWGKAATLSVSKQDYEKIKILVLGRKYLK